jgi:phenylpropionate dioxygenase-like ring-hydroxylating dioxygenase large terminal subunit
MLSSTAAVASHPAGGTDLDRFDWREVWYPVHYLKDLDKTKPTPFTLLDRDLVIWWDKNQATWCVFEDKCPHRLAPLSEGRVNEAGHLECPYHGWSFSGAGQCEGIPQQPEGTQAETSQRACIASFATTIRQGLLFVYAGNPENAPRTKVPIIEPMEEEPDGWICLDTFRDLPYDALTLMENVLDASHVPYTHHLTIGNRANASPVELQVTSADRQGFTGVWPEGPRRGKLGTQYTTFLAPGLMWHDLTSKQFGRTLTVVYATPIRQGECRLFARFPFKFASNLPKFFIKLTPTWYSHLNQNAILEDDQIFLYFQERYLEEGGGSENFTKAFYLPTKADLFVFQLRSWVNQYHAEPFPGVPFPPRQAKEVLLDRYHSHTKNCASCQGALKNLNRIRTLLAVIAVGVGGTLPLVAWLFDRSPWAIVAGVAVTLGSAGLWWRLGELKKQFYVGRLLLPRNTGKKG